MLVLVIVDTILVVLLAGLVAGLLRSHTEILRALHSLDARVGEPPTALVEQPTKDDASESAAGDAELSKTQVRLRAHNGS